MIVWNWNSVDWWCLSKNYDSLNIDETDKIFYNKYKHSNDKSENEDSLKSWKLIEEKSSLDSI